VFPDLEATCFTKSFAQGGEVLDSLLRYDPQQRVSAADLLFSPWFVNLAQ
jgi:hypothetical protein